MTPLIPESIFTWVSLVGTLVPPRDPSDDDDKEEEEDDDHEANEDREPAVIREPGEDSDMRAPIKSRLTAALLERLATEPHTRLRYFCSPQHTDSAFFPIIGQMERAAGLVQDDAPQARLDKLDAVLAQTSTSKQDAALLADMLSLSNDGRYPTLELTARQRRRRSVGSVDRADPGHVLGRSQPVETRHQRVSLITPAAPPSSSPPRTGECRRCGPRSPPSRPLVAPCIAILCASSSSPRSQ